MDLRRPILLNRSMAQEYHLYYISELYPPRNQLVINNNERWPGELINFWKVYHDYKEHEQI